MKKAIFSLFIVFLSLVFCMKVEGDTRIIKDVACNYTFSTSEGTIGPIQIQILNYNGTSPSIRTLFTDKSGNFVEYNVKTTGTTEFKGNEYNYSLFIFQKGTSSSTFIKNFKNGGETCPSIYLHGITSGDNRYEIESTAGSEPSNRVTSALLSAWLKGTESGADWQVPNDFYKDTNSPTPTTPKEDIVCNYSSLDFPLMTSKRKPVLEFRKYYTGTCNPCYKITFDGSEKTFTNLNGDVEYQATSGSANVTITSAEVKKIFNAATDSTKCLTVYPYVYNQSSDPVQYIITTNKDEAEENGLDHKHGETTPNVDTEPTEDWSFPVGSVKSCGDILGTSGQSLVKAFIIGIRILTPILLFLFTAFEFAKAIPAQDEEALSKAWKRFGTRAIITVLIMLLPTFMNLIGQLIGIFDNCNIW